MDIGWKWEATGHWVRPNTARDVMSVLGAVGVYSTGQRFAWRGVSSADFTVASSLHRAVGGDEETVRTAELEILTEAREWGLGTYPTGRVDDLQLLSDLQHFGIPTRLIDMTSNPMTALWFACQPAPDETSKSGVLLALNITKWPRLLTVPDAGAMTWSQLGDPHGARLTAQLASQAPFVVESASPNARLRAQEGFFVTGSVPPGAPEPVIEVGSTHLRLMTITPFESISVSWPKIEQEVLAARLTEPRTVGAPHHVPFVAIIINAGLKPRLLKYLEGTFNRSARTLFPDYEGYRAFGRHVGIVRS